METRHWVLVAVLCSAGWASATAGATEPPPRPGATPFPPAAEADADVKAAPPKPDAQKKDPSAKKPAPRRRAVYQQFDRPLMTTPPVGAQPLPTPIPTPAPVQVVPGPTTFIPNGCLGGNCNDPGGNRYQGGVGTTLIGPQGKLCSNNGVTVQCL